MAALPFAPVQDRVQADSAVESLTTQSSTDGMTEAQVHDVLIERLPAWSSDQVSKLAHHLSTICDHYRFDAAVVLALIEVESSFKTNALSHAGAVGLMQLMPATARVVIRDLNPPLDEATLKTVKAKGMSHESLHEALMDPFTNVSLGVAYLSSLREHYEGFHPYFPLAAYNVGPSKIDSLMSRKTFKPAKTKKYFEAIRQGIFRFRTFRKSV